MATNSTLESIQLEFDQKQEEIAQIEQKLQFPETLTPQQQKQLQQQLQQLQQQQQELQKVNKQLTSFALESVESEFEE